MRNILIAIFFILSWASNKCFSQSSVQANVIRGLSEFRTNIIVNKLEETQELANTLKLFESWGISDQQLEEIIFQFQYAKNIYDLSDHYILKKIRKEYKKESWTEKILANHIAAITANPEICDFINMGVISMDYPFQISAGTAFKELEFYDIQPNEAIADVGAGKGTFTLLLYMAAQSNKIYYTEIDNELILYFYESIKKGYVSNNDSEIIMVKGEKKNTKLSEKVDKIIVRNTFHHFKDKKAMLKSIKESLKPNGRLYLKESIADKYEHKKDRPCKHIMEEEKIKSYLEKAGFRLVKEQWEEKVLLMEYVWGTNKS